LSLLQPLEDRQLAALRALLGLLCRQNAFYGPRLRDAGLDESVASLDAFRERMPFTTKAELVDDQLRHAPYGSNLSYPLASYTRLHQTSGTSGQPLRWLDTPESWDWMVDAWTRVFAHGEVGVGDRVFFPFSFGPFLGFWTAFEAAGKRGALALPGGGLSTLARLRMLLDNEATVLCCTPTYALRLAESAADEGFDLAARSPVRKVIVAGEPGGGVAGVRQRLMQAWGGAEILDHHGMTEVGPVSYPNRRLPGILHIIEDHYLAEILDRETLAPVGAGEIGELVLTTLGRAGSPLLRYRTGDLVRRARHTAAELGSPDLALDGGILARSDDMVVVRGVNLYPSAVDQVVRALPDIAEYQVELRQDRAMTEVRLRVEPMPNVDDPVRLAQRLEEALRTAFQLRIPVDLAPPESLPRFELKARRWVRGV
jgi:phenylacetate-CoA ligase